MNCLSTIAALPSAGGCKAALAAESSVPNVSSAPSIGVDMAGGPDSCVMAVIRGWPPLVISQSFTVGDVSTISDVRRAISSAACRSRNYGPFS